jgi:hypothetical protein
MEAERSRCGAVVINSHGEYQFYAAMYDVCSGALHFRHPEWRWPWKINGHVDLASVLRPQMGGELPIH